MPLHTPSSQKTACLAVLMALAAHGAPPQAATFTQADAIRAEWDRKPPVLGPEALAALPAADRERLELTLKRIGAPGAPPLLPPWLETPTAAVWEAKALEARTPQDRFTALTFLNRLKSTKALTALDSLMAEDAAKGPAHLHLEGPVVTAILNGCEASGGSQAFQAALRKAGKTDPAREAAALLRLVLEGKLKGEARMSDPTSLLFLDAWNRGPWDIRAKEHMNLLAVALGTPGDPGPAQRLLEGLPDKPVPGAQALALQALGAEAMPIRMAALDYLAKVPALEPEVLAGVKAAAFRNYGGPLSPGFVVVLRRHLPADALRYDKFLLGNDDILGMASALEDLPEAPANLEPLIKRIWKTSHYDAVQAFLPALERWNLPLEQRKAILARFLDHPCWTARLDAYNLLVKLDPATAWPKAPAGSFMETPILEEALRLAKAAKPVRLRIVFQGFGPVVLKLDPVVAPINVATLSLLARRGFFNGRLVPRVVPDFVVQMGSPTDSMDGGPGYTVRCEDSLNWYGPGSVGMALSGKDTGGSQFFITTNATPHLTGKYTRVGEVEDPETALPILDRLTLGTKILKVEVF